MHKATLVMDFQYGSTGKGLIAGYLARRETYDTAVCSFATNAGHTYIAKDIGTVMTQQLPTAGVVSPTVKNILIGPGAAIHAQTLLDEIIRYGRLLKGKRIMIHPQAAVVEDYHSHWEVGFGMASIGSTTKGVGAAYIERIKRQPNNNTAWNRWGGGHELEYQELHPLSQYVVTEREYRETLDRSDRIIIEGAQGFSLSMYHGQYPYTTSRDVTPMQIAADCGLPMKWMPYIEIIGTLRTYPIRVNNRTGTSGPCYADQQEITWADIGVDPELTTVTKLPRRIFTFSHEQLQEAMWHCGGYWNTSLFLNFANYMAPEKVRDLIKKIQVPKSPGTLNPPKVMWVGTGPTDADVIDWGPEKPL